MSSIDVKQLGELERTWRRGVYRVGYTGGGVEGTCPPDGQRGVSLGRAIRLRARIEVIAPLLDIDLTTLRIVGPGGEVVKTDVKNESRSEVKHAQAPVKMPPSPAPLTPNQRRALQHLDNVDMSLLVNPEALEEVGSADVQDA